MDALFGHANGHAKYGGSNVLDLLAQASGEYEQEVCALREKIDLLESKLAEAEAKAALGAALAPATTSFSAMTASATSTDKEGPKEEEAPDSIVKVEEDPGKSPPRQSRKASTDADGTGSVLMDFADEPEDDSRRFQVLFEHYMDITATIVVMLHIVFLIIQMQYSGQVIAEDAGLAGTSVKNDTYSTTLVVFDHIFNGFFVIEMGVRLYILRKLFFITSKKQIQWFNILELCLVVTTSIDLYAGNHIKLNFNSFRPIVRFIRLLRMLRLLKLVRFFFKLRILVMTVAASFMALFWSIILLVITMLIAAFILNQSLIDSMNDENLAYDTRQWIFIMYGTSTRSFWSVFELTFSGGWPNYARRLVEEVNFLWSVFFFVYIIAVVFAMFRIITALFLRDTLALAANDAETAMQEKTRAKAAISKKLRDFFEAADTSGDGMLSLAEFEEMLLLPKVRTWLSLLELDVQSATEVFTLLEDDDNCVSVEDFIKGMMRIKGQAKAQEVYHILVKQKVIHDTIMDMSKRMENIDRATKLTDSAYQLATTV